MAGSKNNKSESYEDKLLQQYIKTIENESDLITFPDLANLKQNSKLKQNPDYLIVLAEGTFERIADDTSERTNNHIKGSINLSNLLNNELLNNKSKKYIAAIEQKGRKILEGKLIDEMEFSVPEEMKIKKFKIGMESEIEIKAFRWAAGGAIPIFNLNRKKYVAFILKDKNASVHPLNYATASGLSEFHRDKTVELEDPRAIIGREFFEEIRVFNKKTCEEYHFNFCFNGKCGEDCIKDPSKCEDVPFLTYIQETYEDDLSSNLSEKKHQDFIKELGRGVKGCPEPSKNNQNMKVNCKILTLSKDELTINLEKDKSTTISMFKVVIDPTYGAVDVIGAIEIDLKGARPNDIEILDYERITKNNEFLHRKIFLVDSKNLKKLIKGYEYNAILYEYVPSVKKVNIGHYKMKEKPAMNPPLWESIVELYNNYLRKKREKEIEFGYSYHESKVAGERAEEGEL